MAVRIWAAALTVTAALLGCGGGGGSNPAGAGNGDGTAGAPPEESVALVTKASTPSDASRFLTHASFGPTQAEIDRVLAIGYDGWLAEQFERSPAQTHLQYWQSRAQPGVAVSADWINHSFWRNAIAGDDQLRQRVAFALSQIFVVSLNDAAVGAMPRGVASYFDMLGRNAFGNFRQLLEDVSLHPMMGLYLTHLRNQGQADRFPDENYAREVMQLFTIGLYELHPDGTPKLDGAGNPVETYTNDDVSGLAKVFTGWSWAGPDRSDTRFNGNPADPLRDVTPMQAYPQFHATTDKVFLGGSCPGGTMPEPSLKCALDRLAAHPNVGPFIGRQLIQRLVTSNPSPAYVKRVAAAFADDGSGVRGNLKAVLRAILLDPEARVAPAPTDVKYGKPREPVLRMAALLRATGATSTSGNFLIPNTENAANSLGQSPMRAPSVFNFWRPGYVPPGTELASAGLVAPELQLLNETSVAAYLNLMQTTIQSGIGEGNPRDVRPDLSELAALADNADALLERLSLLLAGGQMSPGTRQRIRDVVNSIAIPNFNPSGATTARTNRTMIALLLLVASPEFLAQK
jgi:uncharacterized protein (DUF1800 family)